MKKWMILLAALALLSGCARKPVYGETRAGEALGFAEELMVSPYREEDCHLLSSMIYDLGEDAPYICKVALGAIAVNRTMKDGYPDTLPEVIREMCPNVSGLVSDASNRAAADAVCGTDPTGGATEWGAAPPESVRATLSVEGYVFWKRAQDAA